MDLFSAEEARIAKEILIERRGWKRARIKLRLKKLSDEELQRIVDAWFKGDVE